LADLTLGQLGEAGGVMDTVLSIGNVEGGWTPTHLSVTGIGTSSPGPTETITLRAAEGLTSLMAVLEPTSSTAAMASMVASPGGGFDPDPGDTVLNCES
jgi:hypothetical protein